MTRNTKLLSAAAMALSLVALAGPANAQFGPMSMGMRMGMGPMGMGMRGGPMGMGGMRMAPGMGSARYREIHAPAPRRSRYREVYEEPPPRHVHARKPAPAVTHGSRVTAAVPTPVAQGKGVQTNVPVSTSLSTVQPQQATQSQQTPQAVKQAAPAAPVQQQPQLQAQPLQNPAPVVTTSTPAVSNVGTDSALPTRLGPTTRPHNCLTKLHLKDGTVILQDFCTLEQAVIKQGDGNRTEIQPTSSQQTPVAAPHQAPAQLARSR